MSDPDSRLLSHRRCPQCGSRVKRVLRSESDKRRIDADHYRRYRCRSDGCDWQGLMTVSERRRGDQGPDHGDASVLTRVGRALLLLLAAGSLAWGGMRALQFMMGL